ncbi:uncharacterized protein LOC101235228 isoform X1 [Hydra vulgaris]|uniref:uncharacterized protein LOC101235228 isoform X1 n=1 Tax=Hydra vulgaris TaxID=6087 RepID=UPI0002B487D3|nr:uncharacterized protein LOC101235228 [Hydra vulgaris]
MDKPNYALSERLAATAEVQDIINLVKEELFHRSIHCLDIYDAVTYRFQSTNCGTNILIKVRVSHGRFLHAKVYVDFNNNIKLIYVDDNKGICDPLSPRDI